MRAFQAATLSKDKGILPADTSGAATSCAPGFRGLERITGLRGGSGKAGAGAPAAPGQGAVTCFAAAAYGPSSGCLFWPYTNEPLEVEDPAPLLRPDCASFTSFHSESGCVPGCQLPGSLSKLHLAQRGGILVPRCAAPGDLPPARHGSGPCCHQDAGRQELAPLRSSGERGKSYNALNFFFLNLYLLAFVQHMC